MVIHSSSNALCVIQIKVDSWEISPLKNGMLNQKNATNLANNTSEEENLSIITYVFCFQDISYEVVAIFPCNFRVSNMDHILK